MWTIDKSKPTIGRGFTIQIGGDINHQSSLHYFFFLRFTGRLARVAVVWVAFATGLGVRWMQLTGSSL